ncbi:glycosyltransferase [Halobacillus sp. Marseille-Q1614]|uniref:glycosyltransferase n=1 Tax=Halobacillus sp. Marseille-Q1614 TaxID=2709134 RepID=UPI0015706496|nr:glycosyltransferase [Halobacillus sp. Marseille-Q1614]
MDKKQPIFFLMNSIDLVRGGLTKASLKQASTFAEMGFEVYMLTFNYNLNYPGIRKELIEMDKIHPKVTILNQYEELDGHINKNPSRKTLKKATLKDLADGGVIDKRKGKNAYRIYQNGMYVKYIDYGEDDHLRFIDYFNENRYRTKREEYDPKGHIKRVSYMDFQKNKPCQIIYYNQKGNAYLSEWVNPNTGELTRINKFDPKTGEVTKKYRDGSVQFKTDWVNQLLKNYKDPVIVSDTRSTDEILAKVDSSLSVKLWRLHSSHVHYPFDQNGEIATKVKTGIENLDNYDGALVLTEQQRQDLIKRFGREDFFHTVPHYHECKQKNGIKKLLTKDDKTDPTTAVVVSRLSTLKRIDHPIKAFKKVAEAVPHAKLEIWGTGTEEEKLKKLIIDLNLEDHVSVKGYTHDPDDVYQRGLFSVLTSKSEGFALSVLESAANRTPVVSYNVRYGPEDLIMHNETGKLVEDKNINALADEMIDLFQNPKRTKEMGERAAAFIQENFNKEIYKEKFLLAIEKAEDNKKAAK